MNLDKKKVQLELKLQLIALLSDVSVKIINLNLRNDLKEIPSIDNWKQYEKSPIINISLEIFKEKT